MPIKPAGVPLGHSRGMSSPVIEHRPAVAEWTPDEALLRRFDGPGPRCTSSPTADRFVDAFGAAPYRQALARRCSAGAAGTGLPRQTPASYERTIAQLAPPRPDRIALYGYAHLPQHFKPQRRIEPADLPSPAQRLHMLAGAIRGLTAQGCSVIGMDHFALPEDAFAIAKRQGRLHRSFQGYGTQPDCDLIALGVSAIGKVGATCSQNAKTLPEYGDILERGELPVVRGIALMRDDLVHRAGIMALMCRGRLDFESMALAHRADFRVQFAHELAQMQGLVEQGLVEIEADGLQLTREGWFFVRAVAMVFDRGLQSDPARAVLARVAGMPGAWQ